MLTRTGHRGTEAQRSFSLKHSPFLRLCVSVASCLVLLVPVWLSHAWAQVLIDRVLARVDGAPLTLTDIEAAIGLGIVQGPSDAATQQMINRLLELTEVQRFPPPEPPSAAVAAEAARLKMNAGARLQALMQSTGLTDQRIADIARDNLRIAAYLDQRFGTSVQVSDDEVANYYRSHEAEFTRGGDAVPLDDAETIARQRVSDERRRTIIDQWLADLRNRADVGVNGSPIPDPGSGPTP
jgi:hypothetical protein